MAKSSTKTVSTVSQVMAITLFGKLLGLWRDRLLVISYGTGLEANAFYTASRIPRVFFDAIFASAIAVCLIPVFSRSQKEEGDEEANAFASNFISVLAAVSALLTLLGIVFAPQMVSLFADGYPQETKDLAISLTQLMFPSVFFTGLAFSFVGILQANERFLIPAFISTVSNAIIIAYFFLGDQQFGIVGLSVAFLVGWSAQAFVQIPTLRQTGFRYRPNFSFTSPKMKQVYRLMAPVMISTWVQPIQLTINTRFASHLHEGAGVSILEIATNLYLIIAGVFILSITNVIFPKLSKLTVSNQEEDFQATLGETLHISIFFTLPMAVGLAVVAEPLIALIYGGGEFDESAIALTAGALTWVSFGMVGYGVQNIISRGFFAKENGNTPLIAGIFSILCNICLCSVLVEPLGVNGLAISSTLSSTLYGLILLFALEKQGSKILTTGFLKDIATMFLLSLLLYGVASSVLALLLPFGSIVALGVTALVGGITYLFGSLLFNLPETKIIKQFLHRKGG